MRHRSIVKMILLSIVTLGIYSLYWSISTKNEMNRLGAEVPTAWLLIIPFVSIYWMWKYSQAVEHITGGKIGAPLAFVMEWFLGFIGDIIIQTEFNKMAQVSAGGTQSYDSPTDGGPMPDNTFGGPVAPVPPSSPAPAPYSPASPSTAAEQPTSFTPGSQAPADVTAVASPTLNQPQPPVPTPPQVQ